MALLSFVESSTPSLQAQGEQRRSFFFNIPRDNSLGGAYSLMVDKHAHAMEFELACDELSALAN